MPTRWHRAVGPPRFRWCAVHGLRGAWERSSNLVQLQLQAAIRQVPAGNLEPGGRQLDPSLEMPVRDLQPVDPGVPDFARQRGFAADDQDASAERHLDLVELDPGQGDQDGQRLVALEDVARRLPGGGRAVAMKKLPVEALGAFHRLAGLFPHQRFELFRHLSLPAPADIVTQPRAAKAPRHPRLGGRCETGYQPVAALVGLVVTLISEETVAFVEGVAAEAQ